MWTAQKFYDLAKANGACTNGLQFLRQSVRINRKGIVWRKDLREVPASYLFDKMLAHYNRTGDEDTFSGAGYLRWTFLNLLEWPRNDGGYGHTHETRLIMDSLLDEAGCKCSQKERYGTGWFITPTDVRAHLGYRCPHVHGMGGQKAMEVIHRALCRAFK